MNTKERIIETALKLFNQSGINEITVRHIAKELNMSHGNLCYHFATKENIIFKLYENLVAEFDAYLEDFKGKEITFIMLAESSTVAITVFYKYKFLMLDLVSIVRESERIKTNYNQLLERRKEEFFLIFHKLISSGLMREEQYPGEFENLITAFFIIGDFWICHSVIHYKGKEEDKIPYYASVLFSLLVPYLTSKGLFELSVLKK